MYRREPLIAAAALAAVVLLTNAQTPPPKLKFEVASVKPNKSNGPPNSNFPLGPGDVYVRNGGFFSASGFPLSLYIAFAYKMIGNQGQFFDPQLPDWARAEHFDIQARAAGDPGKDDMRMMMRSLLADRFKLAVHYEEREVPVFAFVLAKPGKTGPQLRPHSDGAPCPTEQSASAPPPPGDDMPPFCNGIYPLRPSVRGRYRFGARNIAIGFIADTFSAGTNLGRPMVDQTGLSGKFDFSLEWSRDTPLRSPAEAEPDPSALSFEEALREQLGIKLQSRKAPVKVLVLDHVERPSEN